MDEMKGTKAKPTPTPPTTVVAAVKNRRLPGLTSSPLIRTFSKYFNNLESAAAENRAQDFINYFGIF
jgi:hypothetical protein